MFLRKIYIENYRTLKKSEVTFEDGLNIIIGKNGSGKSNLLQFIETSVDYYSLFHLADYQNYYDSYSATFSDKNDYGNSEELTLTVQTIRTVKGESISYQKNVTMTLCVDDVLSMKETFSIAQGENIRTYLQKGESEKSSVIESELTKLFHFGSHYILFAIPSRIHWLSNPGKLVFTTKSFVEKHYGELQSSIISLLEVNIELAFLKNITGNETKNLTGDIVHSVIQAGFEKTFLNTRLVQNLQQFSPIEDVRLTPNINIYSVADEIFAENLLIEFLINENWIPWSYLSDGTKRLFYIISECLSFNDGLFLIEEPELGIHPHQLFALMTFLKEQSETKQIIISTHSPLVLDALEPDELNRINVAELQNGASVFRKLTSEQQEKAREYMMETDNLSNYWLHSDLENYED